MLSLNVSQAYATLRMLVKPPVSPPYALMVFYLTAVIAALGDLYTGSTESTFSGGYVLLTLLWIFIPLLLTWLSGTLPLQPISPGINVSSPGSVRIVVPRVAQFTICTPGYLKQIYLS